MGSSHGSIAPLWNEPAAGEVSSLVFSTILVGIFKWADRYLKFLIKPLSSIRYAAKILRREGGMDKMK